MPWPNSDLGRPVRAVLFGGAFLEPAAVEFLLRLDAHPEVDFLGGFCQSPGFDLRQQAANIIRRRGLLSPLILGVYGMGAAGRFVRAPLAERDRRQRAARALSRMIAVPDIHADDVLQRVRALAPDLGLIYGSPILKPELFEIPAFGTLGIHHGKLPEYRGKKTTFWAMFNGERTAGVAVQRICAGLDRGEIVSSAEVPTAGKRYGRLAREVQQLGLDLYMEAVLAVKRGQASSRPQPGCGSPLYRQPGAADILRLWSRQLAPGWLRR